MRFVPFGCIGTVCLLTKLGVKRAELVQKFVPRSRVEIFRNERTRSTPLDPKLMFWYVLYYLSAFGTVWLPYETRCKTGRTSAKVRATKSHRTFSQRTHPIQPIDPKLTFSGPFGCVTKHGEQGAKVVQKFMPRSRVEIFRNERTRSIPLDPKLTVWCVSYYFGAFGTNWLPYKTRCKMGQTSAKVRDTKSCRNFSQRTHPILPIGP